MFTNANRPTVNRAAAGRSIAGASDQRHHSAASTQTQVISTLAAPDGIKILLNGSPVATVRDGILYRTIHTRHIFKNAICFLNSILEAAEANGARVCIVRDADTGATYTAHLNDLWLHSWPLENAYGAQRAMPLSRFATSAEQVAAQLSLWGAE